MGTELAAHLVKNGLLSPAQADDMLQRQVLYGGSFDTQLLETGAVGEQACLEAMGELYDMPVVSCSEIDQTPPEVPVTFPLLFAQMHNLVPHRFESGALIAITNRPPSPSELEGLMRRLGVNVQIKLVTEPRVHYALNKLYGVEIPPRYSRILHRIDGKPAGGIAGKARMAAVWSALLSPPARTGVEGEAAEWRSYERLDLEDIRRQLNDARQRDRVIDIMLHSLLSSFEFSALFAVLHGNIAGWTCRGGAGNENIRQVSMPLTMPSMLQTVVLTESPYLGRVPKNTINKQLLDEMGRPWPAAVFLAPLRVGGKVVAVAYSDTKSRNIDNEVVQDLVVTAAMVSRALENVVRLRKYNLRKTLAKQDAIADLPEEAAEESSFEVLSDIMVYESEAVSEPVEFVENPETEKTADDGWDDLTLDSSIADALPAAAATAASTDAAAKPSRVEESWESVLYEGIDQAAGQIATTPAETAEKTPQRSPEVEARWMEVVDELRFGAQRAIGSEKEDEVGLWLDQLEGDPEGWDAAISNLLEYPPAVLVPSLRERFPGKLAVDPFQPGVRLPVPEQLSPLLKLLVLMGEEAKDIVSQGLRHEDPKTRFVAAYLLSRLYLPDIVADLGALLRDPEPKVRFASSYSMRRYEGSSGYEAVLTKIRASLGEGKLTHRIEAIHLVSQLRDSRSVPFLIDLIGGASAAIITAVTAALLTITGHAFGKEVAEWKAWYQSNAAKKREEWLIEGLASSDATVRKVSNSELQGISGFDAGFVADAPAEQRAVAIERWRQWLASRKG